MRFCILGPVLIHDVSGRPLTIGGARLRTLLTPLLLRPGHSVSVAVLAGAVWGDAPPVSTGNALQALVCRLRRVLGEEARIHGDASGYRLVIAPRQVDLCEFEDLAQRGRDRLAAGRAAASRSRS